MSARRPVVGLFAAALAFAAAGAAPAAAQVRLGAEGDALLLADEVVHDEEARAVIATGSVELSRGGRVLRADSLRYDRAADTVTAEGRVALTEPDGRVTFAERAELAGDLKSGVVRAMGVLFTDGSRLAAAGGRRTADGRSELAKAVYSPCAPCADDPDRPPLWRVRAARAVHDPADRTMLYTDATFDLFGVPVLYTPVFTQPDATVRRKTGLLTPTVGRNSTFGFTWGQPYFLVLSPHSDATFSPVLLSEDWPILAGQYRRRTETGFLLAEASATRDTLSAAEARDRGHVNLAGDFEPGDRWGAAWRYGFVFERASDPTYLRRYDFGRDSLLPASVGVAAPGRSGDSVLALARGRSFLTQNAYLRARGGGAEFSLDAYRFQSLDPEADSSREPWVAPLVDFRRRGAPGRWGGAWTIGANLRAMTRRSGSDSRRISAEIGWSVPFSTGAGDRYRFAASLRADGYHTDAEPGPRDAERTAETGFAGRALPQLSLDWRWPWVRAAGSWRLLAEPLAKAVAAPPPGNPDRIENEDSLAFEFDEINLFSVNRFPGLDRVEGGLRAAYGVRLGAFAPDGAGAEFLVGQAFRPREDDSYAAGSGLEGRLSDLVGRLAVRPAEYFDLSARFRLDPDALSTRRGALALSAGPDRLRGAVDYAVLAKAAPGAGDSPTVKQVNARLSYGFADNWRLTAHHRHELGDEEGPLATGATLIYRDECIAASVGLRRSYAEQLDVADSTDVVFQVKLRNFD